MFNYISNGHGYSHHTLQLTSLTIQITRDDNLTSDNCHVALKYNTDSEDDFIECEFNINQDEAEKYFKQYLNRAKDLLQKDLDYIKGFI